MSGIRIVLLMGLLGGFSANVRAEAPSATTREEITGLLHALGASHCDFYRNGSWYDSTNAESHLQRKLDYFERKDLLSTTDAFIEDAASQSSMSGEAYQVRCPDQPAQPSADWLKQKLQELRQRGADTPH